MNKRSANIDKKSGEYTLLIYMIGSTLEDEHYAATNDTKEMLKANSNSSNVNVILEPVELQDDNQSNNTSVNAENSTKYIQYEHTCKGLKISSFYWLGSTFHTDIVTHPFRCCELGAIYSYSK